MDNKKELETQQLLQKIAQLEKAIAKKFEESRRFDYISMIDLQIKKLQTTLADTNDLNTVQGLSMTIAMLAEKAFYMSQKVK